jgi:hypothetical protein
MNGADGKNNNVKKKTMLSIERHQAMNVVTYLTIRRKSIV